MATVISRGSSFAFSVESDQAQTQPVGVTYVIEPGSAPHGGGVVVTGTSHGGGVAVVGASYAGAGYGGDVAAAGAVTRITLGGGHDHVFYNEGSGRAEILGFTRGDDVVHLNVSVGASHIDDFTELLQLASVSTGENSVTVAFDGGDALTLTGVSDLSPSDWVFFG